MEPGTDGGNIGLIDIKLWVECKNFNRTELREKGLKITRPADHTERGCFLIGVVYRKDNTHHRTMVLFGCGWEYVFRMYIRKFSHALEQPHLRDFVSQQSGEIDIVPPPTNCSCFELEKKNSSQNGSGSNWCHLKASPAHCQSLRESLASSDQRGYRLPNQCSIGQRCPYNSDRWEMKIASYKCLNARFSNQTSSGNGDNDLPFKAGIVVVQSKIWKRSISISERKSSNRRCPMARSLSGTKKMPLIDGENDRQNEGVTVFACRSTDPHRFLSIVRGTRSPFAGISWTKNSVPEEAPKCIRRKRREFPESYRRCHCPIASTSGGANKRAHYEKTPHKTSALIWVDILCDNAICLIPPSQKNVLHLDFLLPIYS
ncbi:hypothetical protein CEXT_282651 [Caerostris extrusa]|uniref:Uncharacterized protein n=1 Tax=Caerostris extrusa TaxID=172846 RepID=A0AAV4WDJ7_CAEEX|nr:hypothetical protein CEXT_282651 [Caerostris extrusa]